jgi:hypothetical protein
MVHRGAASGIPPYQPYRIVPAVAVIAGSQLDTSATVVMLPAVAVVTTVCQWSRIGGEIYDTVSGRSDQKRTAPRAVALKLMVRV